MTLFLAGCYSHDVDDWTLCIDQPRIDRGVLKLLAAAIRAARLTPAEVHSLEFPDERNPLPSVVVEHVPHDFGSGHEWLRTALPLAVVIAEAQRAT